MLVVPGPASKELGMEVVKLLHVPAVSVEHKLFPDGESYLRFTGSLKGDEVVIVQSTGPPQDRNMLQLLLLIRTAKELGAKRVIAVVPYFAYARQEKRYRTGEVVSAKVLVRSLEEVGTDVFITFDLHNPRLLKEFRIKTIEASAMPLLADYFSKLKLEHPFVLSPDQEVPERAKRVAEVLDCEYDWLIKFRDRITGKIETRVRNELNVKGKDVVIVDDIISTGGTILAATKIVKRRGARSVHVGCTHPILAGNALQKLYKAGIRRVIGTNSITSMVSKISLAPEICKVLGSVP